MTQPTEGDIWKMCDTEAGSISLSCVSGQRCLARLRRSRGRARMTYWDLLLRQDDSTILASDAYGHDVGGGDGLEGIFYSNHNASAPV